MIIVDEAHERTVHTDVLLGLLRKIQSSRSQLPSSNFNREMHMSISNGTSKEKQNSVSIFKQCQGTKVGPLKLVIMSASLDARVFSEYFIGAKAVHVQGRQYPVDIFYTQNAEPDYLDAALITVFQVTTLCLFERILFCFLPILASH